VEAALGDVFDFIVEERGCGVVVAVLLRGYGRLD
jgi:hypothetical protein